ncbi:MAG TPA: transposase [Ignavibacteriaceae bacterium]|nr:transposase [Ignavibacteriaceae bacterium]
MSFKLKKQYRLPGFDYSGEGEYFITICIDKRKQYFGKIENGKMILSQIGIIAEKIWNQLPEKFMDVRLDAYQIMPDHFHGIVIIRENKRRSFVNRRNLTQEFKSGIRNNPMELEEITLGRIIRWFKGRVKFESNNLAPDFRWQTRFYDRIIRDEKEFYFISEYIVNNPINWREDILKRYFSNEHHHK